MEVGVKVFVENYMTATSRHVASAYLTFVAVDRHGNKLPVPPVVPETDEEKHRYEDALRRRENRQAELAHKKAKKRA
jgi:acyl-CoA hydrolase